MCLCNIRASRGLKFSKLFSRIIATGEFGTHWVPHKRSIVLQLNYA